MARFERLTRRRDFLAAAAGLRASSRAFSLQAVGRGDGLPRFGFTLTKKTGTAVERNRIRRRLREAVRLVGSLGARDGFDYVLIGRREALGIDFSQLTGDLTLAFQRAHAAKAKGERKDNHESGKR